MSVAAFIILQKWGSCIKSPTTIKTFEFLSPLVFGVYLIHNLLILYVEPWFTNHVAVHGLAATFMRYIVVSILSVLIIWIFSLIPGVRYLLNGTSKKKK